MSSLALELALHPDDVPTLLKLADLRGARGRARPASFNLVWHDTPDGALALQGLSLVERAAGRGTVWRIEQMLATDETVWVPGTPAPILKEAGDRVGLFEAVPENLLPVAAFVGRVVTLATEGGVGMAVMSGELRAVAASRRACRVMLTGEGAAVAACARRLAAQCRLSVPAVTLAAEAIAVARPAPAPRRLGPPRLPPAMAVDDAFSFIAAHLLDVVLHYAPLALAGDAPEPVHQMRVAMRRLRSAFTLFRPVVACAAADEAIAALKVLGQALGPARDWDVFTSGTCAAVVDAFPDDPAIRRMAAQARRRRNAAYEALVDHLASEPFRQLGLTLALLAAQQPWRDVTVVTPAALPEPQPPDNPADREMAPAGEPARSAASLTDYAARALHKRMKRLVAPGNHITDLPVAELHAIRLNGKRLRYAAEFFAPLFPGRETRRFLRRMTKLQERLGHLNDGNVAAALMSEIGHGKGHAGGVVRGFVAAESAGARGRIGRSWKRFRKLDAFWP